MNWWPSKYGADDQAGSLNEIETATMVEAAGLVKEGRVYDLSHTLHQDVPVFPGRTFRSYLTTPAHQINRRRGEGDGLGRNHVNWILEVVTATSQMGTHVDALNHLQQGDRMYNGHTLDDVVEEWGTNRLGIDTLPQVFTRGVLVNIAGHLEVERLEPGHVITVQQVEAALGSVEVGRGDALLFHTGWGNQWNDPDRYLVGEPGPGMAVAEWMVGHGVALAGCDTWSFGPVPPEDPDRPFLVPQTLNTRHGMVIVENLFLSELAVAGVVQFLFILAHPKVKGATGAWVAPLAVV